MAIYIANILVCPAGYLGNLNL